MKQPEDPSVRPAEGSVPTPRTGAAESPAPPPRAGAAADQPGPAEGPRPSEGPAEGPRPSEGPAEGPSGGSNEGSSEGSAVRPASASPTEGATAAAEKDQMPLIIAVAGVLCVVMPVLTLPVAPLLVWASVRCLRTRRPGNPWMFLMGAIGGVVGVFVSVSVLATWWLNS